MLVDMRETVRDATQRLEELFEIDRWRDVGSVMRLRGRKRWLLRNCRKPRDRWLKMSVQSHCGVTGEMGENIYEKQREEVETSG